MRTLRTYDDFATPDGWPGEKWMPFGRPGLDLWDSTTRVSCPGDSLTGLTIEIPHFTLSHPPNHVKALSLSRAAIPVPEGGVLSVHVDMAVTMTGTEANPFGADSRDLRLAAASLNMIDLQSAMVFDFFVGSSRIGTVYERLDFARRPDDPYPSFTLLNTLDVPTEPGQWHGYAIAYDQANDQVTWSVDGAVVASQSNVGVPPQGAGPRVKVRSVHIGGGLFTLLDDLSNDRAHAGDSPKVPGLDPTGRRELFGQGGRVQFRMFRIETITNDRGTA